MDVQASVVYIILLFNFSPVSLKGTKPKCLLAEQYVKKYCKSHKSFSLGIFYVLF